VLPLETDLTLPLPTGASAFLAADFLDAVTTFGFAALFNLLDAITQLPAGKIAVHLARALGLALDFDPARPVVEVDAGAGLVDFLSTVSRSPDESLNEIVFQDPELRHAAFQGVTLVPPDHGAAGAGIVERSAAWQWAM
jgi:hypothetical protein